MADGPAISPPERRSGPLARSLSSALQEGYAAASNDTGHKGGSAAFALGHPEKLKDFADRAVHAMAVKAKIIIAAFYGAGPKLSYWNGCSTGGRQGLMEAQRHPQDFEPGDKRIRPNGTFENFVWTRARGKTGVLCAQSRGICLTITGSHSVGRAVWFQKKGLLRHGNPEQVERLLDQAGRQPLDCERRGFRHLELT